MSARPAHCSWCHRRTLHTLETPGRFGRDAYRCDGCGQPTLPCRFCDDMACGRAEAPPSTRLVARLLGRWGDALCAEHDGRIPSFSMAFAELEDLADWQQLFQRSKTDLRHLVRVIAGAAGGAALLAPLAALAAPGLAASLGVGSMLGAGSTGVAVETLAGSALARASLSVLGRGLGLRGGLAVMAAAGAALGAREGALVSHAYLGQVDGFGIRRLGAGRGPALVMVDGFLTAGSGDGRDWEPGLAARYDGCPRYHVAWESKRLRAVAGMAAGAGANLALARAARHVLGASSDRRPALLSAASVVGGLARNPFHTAVAKASMTGEILADVLARTRHPEGFVLLGHSLGARVIVSALAALAPRAPGIVREVVLLGGAVGGGGDIDWASIVPALAEQGRIYNAYSGRDAVMKRLYPLAMPFATSPIAVGPIDHACPQIVDVDVSRIVDGHTQYKPRLGEVLAAVDASR